MILTGELLLGVEDASGRVLRDLTIPEGRRVLLTRFRWPNEPSLVGALASVERNGNVITVRCSLHRNGSDPLGLDGNDPPSWWLGLGLGRSVRCEHHARDGGCWTAIEGELAYLSIEPRPVWPAQRPVTTE